MRKWDQKDKEKHKNGKKLHLIAIRSFLDRDQDKSENIEITKDRYQSSLLIAIKPQVDRDQTAADGYFWQFLDFKPIFKEIFGDIYTL